MPEPILCLRCHTSMETGFIADANQAAHVQEQWAAGNPEPSVWGGVKTRGKDLHPVTTFRCPNCGYLESYARSTAL